MDQKDFDRHVEQVRRFLFPPENGGWSAQDLAAFFFRDWSSPYVEQAPLLSPFLGTDPDSALQHLIDGSETNRIYWDALVEIARGRLIVELHSGRGRKNPVLDLIESAKRGTPRLTLLTDPMLDWIADVLGDHLRDRKDKRRPRPRKSRWKTERDELICMLIWSLRERESINPMRNGAGPACCWAEGGSGCDIVGAAVNLAQKKVDSDYKDRKYKNFERIWLKGKKGFIPYSARESGKG